ncbi:MAG TPA: NADH-quinone oxidoreductase subunit M [Tepidisphaeraceae bacterium]|nr:NADH-quinone oxidoreductase subunit M [Tepidisphaeraceae bacterium]
MQDKYSLLLLLLVPLLGAAVGAFMPSRGAARGWALAVSVITLMLGVGLAWQMNLFAGIDSSLSSIEATRQTVQLQYGADAANNKFAIDKIGFSFHLGLDTVSLWLVLLTVFLQPLVVLSSWDVIKDRATEYYAWMSLLLAAMLGVFIARDLLLFYVFFELTLVPMFFIIGIWGGPERRFAAGKFFLYTFTGGVFTLAAVLYLGTAAQSFDVVRVIAYAQANLSSTERFWVFMALLAGFAVKVPLFPVHTWLPLAHTEAPTAGSVILAGVLLKLGTYGLLRVAFPIGLLSTSEGVISGGLIGLLGALCVVGVIYGALVAWVQKDIKKLVAYSSVSHLGFCVLGLVSLTDIGLQGSVLYMINHGLSTGAMFLVIGMIYDRYHTRDINALSGLGKNMPIMSFFFIFFVMSSIGLPGTNGFVSEYLTIQSAFISPYLGVPFGVLAATGVVLGAIYMLHMSAKIIFGPLKVPAHEEGHGATHGNAAVGADSHAHGHAAKNDLNAREIGILVPLAIAVIWLGVRPTPILQSMTAPLALSREPLSQHRSADAATSLGAPLPAEQRDRKSDERLVLNTPARVGLPEQR